MPLPEIVTVAEWERIKTYEDEDVKGKINAGLMLTDAVWLLMNQGKMSKSEILQHTEQAFDVLEAYGMGKLT